MANDSMQAAYQEILNVALDMLGIPGVVLYRPSAEGDRLEPGALTAARAGAAAVSEPQLIAAEVSADSSAVSSAFRDHRPLTSSTGEVAIPIVYGDDVLGVIATSGLTTCEIDQEAAVGVLWRLAGESALVIRAAQVAEDLSAGQLEIDDLITLADQEAATP